MAASLCRYDYVVQAVEALQKYMDTCSREDNTLLLIQDAKSAVEALEEIELGIGSRASAQDKKAKLTPAMTECKLRYAQLTPLIKNMQAHIDSNRHAFDSVKQLYSAIKNIEDTHKAVLNINESIGQRIERVQKGYGNE